MAKNRVRPPEVRFWLRVEKSPEPGGCWEWKSRGRDAKCAFYANGGTNAQRFSYQLHRGPIPDGLRVCSLCGNDRCVNPEHLVLLTQEELNRNIPKNYPTAEERFWSKVSPEAHPMGCMEWTGFLNDGYGAISAGGKSMGAHRFSYELAHGPIPAGLFVCHRCDNPACVNPDHLFVGTNADNVADREAKGRGAIASKNGRAKLTDDQVRSIRDLYSKGGITQREIAERYGVTKGTVSVIVSRRFWKSVA